MPAHKLVHCLTLRMQQYQPVSPALYDTLEELYLLKKSCNLTFEGDTGRQTLVDARLTDFYTEDDGPYLTVNNTVNVRLDAVVALNGKPAHYIV